MPGSVPPATVTVGIVIFVCFVLFSLRLVRFGFVYRDLLKLGGSYVIACVLVP